MPTTWTIDPADSDPLPMSQLIGSQPAPKRGGAGTWKFHLVPDGRGDHAARYERLMAYQDYAGAYAAGADPNRIPWFREQHSHESLLVALRPADDDPTGRGQWALIGAIDDSTEVPQKRCIVDVDLFYLAELDEYNSADAVRNALEANGV